MNNGFFGMLFDMDGNGELDIFERVADLGAFVQMMSDDENEDPFEDTGSDFDDLE